MEYWQKIDVVKKVFRENFEEIKTHLINTYGFRDKIELLNVNDVSFDWLSFWKESEDDIKKDLLEGLDFGKCNCVDCEVYSIGIIGENRFCSMCEDDHFYCDRCQEYRSGSDYHNIGDYCYCENCFDRVGYYCQHCEESFRNDDPCYCENENDEDEEDENDEMQFKVFNNFSKGEYLKVSRGAGIELEFSKFRTYDEEKLKKLRGTYWFKVHDGSVRGDAVEMVSSVMKGKLMEEKTKELLSSASVGIDSSCGYHIHINTKDFKPKDIKHLFRTYIDLEKVFFGLVPQSRQGNRFCMKFAEIYEYNNGFVGQKTKYDLEKKFYNESSKRRVKNRKNYKYDGLRYCWANFHSLFSKNNVEIRLHSGTGNYEKIMNWVALNVAVVQYVKKFGRLQANDIKELLLILLRKDFIAEKTYYFYVDRYNKMKAKRKLYVEEDSN